MANVNKLKGRIVENNIAIPDLAKMINVDKATLYRKLSNNCATFTIREANALVSALNLSSEDAVAIFFS